MTNSEAEYSQAYSDSFLVGFGWVTMAGVWAVTEGGLLPLVAAALSTLVMMFILPWCLVALNEECGIPPSRGPHQ